MMWAARREFDAIHEALRKHDGRVDDMDKENKARIDLMDAENKRALEAIRSTQIKIGLMIIGGLAAALWEMVKEHIHL